MQISRFEVEVFFVFVRVFGMFLMCVAMNVVFRHNQNADDVDN